jgi:putative transposase
MGSTRKRYDAFFKAKVALEAIKGERTISEIASECGVHPNQIAKWKKQLLEEVPEIFSKGRKQSKRKTEDLESELYKQIGQLKVELDWLKKKSHLFD